jgi:hypothetical protein
MKVSEVLAEHGLDIDDVRWYIAALLAGKLLDYRSHQEELTRYIWSGKLEAELYDAEERYLGELQRKVDAGMMDEHALREVVREVSTAKRKRRG